MTRSHSDSIKVNRERMCISKYFSVTKHFYQAENDYDVNSKQKKI